jgi:hypothetical protein
MAAGALSVGRVTAPAERKAGGMAGEVTGPTKQDCREWPVRSPAPQKMAAGALSVGRVTPPAKNKAGEVTGPTSHLPLTWPSSNKAGEVTGPTEPPAPQSHWPHRATGPIKPASRLMSFIRLRR